MIKTSRHLISSDNVILEYSLVSPNKHKENTILLIHGLGGSSKAWDIEQTELAKLGYASFAIDLRGHGLSGRPTNIESYSMSRFASDIKEIIDHEQLKNSILVGHCFGGMIAMIVAATYPDLIHKLILIDTSHKPSVLLEKYVDTTILKNILSKMAHFSPVWRKKKHMNFAHFVGSGDFSKKRVFNDILHTSLKSYLLSLSTALSFDAKYQLKKILAKTLVITGDQDKIFTPSIARYIVKKIQKAELINILNANHVLIINNPMEVTKCISDFIEKY